VTKSWRENGERRSACRISLRKFGGKRLFGKQMLVLHDHIEVNVLEGVYVNMRTRPDFSEHDNEM
jgi:hypothetical protein